MNLEEILRKLDEAERIIADLWRQVNSEIRDQQHKEIDRMLKDAKQNRNPEDPPGA